MKNTDYDDLKVLLLMEPNTESYRDRVLSYSCININQYHVHLHYHPHYILNIRTLCYLFPLCIVMLPLLFMLQGFWGFGVLGFWGFGDGAIQVSAPHPIYDTRHVIVTKSQVGLETS